LLAVPVIALPVISHLALHGGWSPALVALLVGLQTLLLALVFSARLAPVWRGPLALGLAGLAGGLAFHWGRAGLSLSAGLMHATAYILLFAFFASTLAPGREPIVTAFARHIRGGVLPKEVEVYGRQVTRAWCGFFLAQLAASLILYALAPLTVWSFFINILNPFLLVGMFAAEIAYRRWRFRHLPRSRIRDMMRIVSAWQTIAKPTGGSR
jgi:uncharacterized membrane protein